MEECTLPLSAQAPQSKCINRSPFRIGIRRNNIPSRRWLFRITVVIAVFIISTAGFHRTGATNQALQDGGNYHSRSLLSSSPSSSLSPSLSPSSSPSNDSGSCREADENIPVWERCDYECNHLAIIWVIFYAIDILIFFIAIAIVCDEYFVPSLEAISEKLELSEDVAGATFMAAGSSTPELFTSIMGVAFNSDVGVGTIVGSAVFNILIIIALTAALAGQVLVLDIRPLCRDSLFYALSIICFIIFSWDGEFAWYESVSLLSLYVLYIVLMKFNATIMEKIFSKRKVSPIEDGEGDMSNSPEETPVEDTLANQIPPRTLPPIQTNRKDSVISRQSFGALTNSNRHIFHHVKHGEFSSHFTSSQIDLKKFGDIDMPVDPKSVCNVVSRSSPVEQKANQPISNGDLFTMMSPETGGHNGIQSPVATKEDMEIKEIDSIGGDSTYGSQGNFLELPGKAVDADSGIHSAQELTPTVPSEPFFPSYANGENHNQTKRHSIMIHLQHGEHHPHLTGPDADHKDYIESDATTNDADTTDNKLGEEDENESTLTPCPCLPSINMYYPSTDILTSTCGYFHFILKWFLFIVSFPFMCLYTWTIPDCSKPRFKKLYFATFLMSIAWIAAISFGMVTLVTRIGCILNIDHYTMGLVVVAVGTSVPDALSSILVARDGFGDMAVSNAIGSNVFDINLGLGLPYLIRNIFNGMQPISLLTVEEIALREAGGLPITPHVKFGFILLFILAFALTVFTCVRFRLNHIVGISFVTMYVIFLVYAFVQELVCDYMC